MHGRSETGPTFVTDTYAEHGHDVAEGRKLCHEVVVIFRGKLK